MGKKPRSQRRKKGKSMEADDDDHGDERSSMAGSNLETLSDNHTVDDSVPMSLMEGEFDFTPDDESSSQMTDIDFLATGSTSADLAMQVRYQRLRDTLAFAEEISSMKQSAKRESSLRKVFKALSQYAAGPAGQMAVSGRQDEITTACFLGLRSGTAVEQYAACRVLEVASVVLGADHEDYHERVDKQLRRVIMTTSRATPVRVAALRALAMACLICTAGDQQITDSLLDLCEAVAGKEYRGQTVPANLRATALDCWAFLATTIADHRLSDSDDVSTGRGLAILELLKECLDDPSSVDLRSAAGECFALVHEARINLGIAGDKGENTTERRFRRGSWEGSEWEVLMDEVKERITELSTESGYHMTKKAKKEQRATFREFMSTLVDDEEPEEIVSFRGGTITLTSWKAIVQINFLRHCLQGGFQIQLLTNETLQEMFGADGQLLSAVNNLSQVEKRLVMSKTSEASKTADKELTRQRRARNNVKNYFLTADGDDI